MEDLDYDLIKLVIMVIMELWLVIHDYDDVMLAYCVGFPISSLVMWWIW
mgnify:CR=1 FL=1